MAIHQAEQLADRSEQQARNRFQPTLPTPDNFQSADQVSQTEHLNASLAASALHTLNGPAGVQGRSPVRRGDDLDLAVMTPEEMAKAVDF